ncbi:MAG: hypothetical protein Kow00103_08070 [Candidatus Caldatribacteriota bacterium]
MSKNELNTLLELKDNPSLSQRSLAHRLNISLGLTNAILKNLIKRGWVKAQKLTGRKILYLITPKGMARVTSLFYERFHETQHYYQHTKDLINHYFIELYQQGIREVALYGTNQLSEITYLALLDSPLKLHSILTDDPSKKKFLSHEVLTLSDFAQKISETSNPENLTIFSTVNYEDSKILNAEIKKYKNIFQKIKIINLEDVLKK